MKTNSLVLSVVAIAILGACGTGTNQNPLSKYQKSQALQPSDGTIQPTGPEIRYETKIEARVDEKIVYRYSFAPSELFSILAPSQFQFVVGQKATFPIRIRGAFGQMKYSVSVESATLQNLKLENIRVEGNDTIADLTCTASAENISGNLPVGLGELTVKMTITEAKHENPETDKLLKDQVKAIGSVQSFVRAYVVLPAGTRAAQVALPAEVKGENP